MSLTMTRTMILLTLLFTVTSSVRLGVSEEVVEASQRINDSSMMKNSVEVMISPLDPEEAAESARLEELELEEEIAEAEQQLEEIIKAEAEAELELGVSSESKRTQEVKAKAVKNLMEIFGLPEPASSGLSERSRRGPAPEFMIELYNTITDSSGVTRAKNPYNAHVVRSYMERPESWSSNLLYFNISSLEPTESLLEVELHLYRLPTPHQQLHPSLYLTPFYILSLYQVVDNTKLHTPDLQKLLGVHYVPALGSGWEVFNVKKSVEEWLSGQSVNEGFLVSATSLGGDSVPVRFARRSDSSEAKQKQPILVLFNHDTHMEKLLESTHSAKAATKKLAPKIKGAVDSNDTNTFSYETTTPQSSLENPRFHHALLFQDNIRHPNSVGRFRGRRSKNGTLDGQLPEWTSSNSNATDCALHDLFVSFEAIGWSSWIISPKGYNAHFCNGQCVFPLGKEAQPTNHATVQSIINELNIYPGLSRPCCVPTKLLPISLLYYDDQDNVVLKQYVDMVADSCGCH